MRKPFLLLVGLLYLTGCPKPGLTPKTRLPPPDPAVADLVIAADCSAFSYGAFHRDLLAGKKVIIACPKLDNPQGYVEKITELVNQGGVESIEIVHMEVPCCFGLRRLVEIGASRAGRKVPLRETVVSIDGGIEKTN